MSERLERILDGGEVLRFHTVGKSVEQQNVGEHTWRVLIILLYLWPDASLELILAALFHDVPEHVTGDLPAHFLWKYPEVKQMLGKIERDVCDELDIPNADLVADVDHVRLKIADYLELYITVRRQHHSHKARDIVHRVGHRLHLFIDQLPTDEEKQRVRRCFNHFNKH